MKCCSERDTVDGCDHDQRLYRRRAMRKITKAEIEAAAKAVADKVSDTAWDFWLDEAKAALVAADLVRRGRKK